MCACDAQLNWRENCVIFPGEDTYLAGKFVARSEMDGAKAPVWGRMAANVVMAARR